LNSEGHFVFGADLKYPAFSPTACDDFLVGDLRDQSFVKELFAKGPFDEIYQLAADMGGAGFVFTGANDADIMHNSAMINLNVLEAAVKTKCPRVFYSSSACIYPERNQLDPNNPICTEESAYPAAPDSEYGWEKLFSERVFAAFRKNHGIETRIARYHNIYGPEGTYDGGREKVPAAICRKVALAADGGEIEVWGTGEQTRSFLYVDECVEGTIRLMRSDYASPVNVGSTEMVSIDELVDIVAKVAGKRIKKKHVPGPRGVMGRNSDNTLIKQVLRWAPKEDLRAGIASTYRWISEQLAVSKAAPETGIAARMTG
jgi:nucleoside-diphosphate-sugar epimerase